MNHQVLTDNEIHSAIQNAPLAQGLSPFVIGIGRAIEKQVIAKQPPAAFIGTYTTPLLPEERERRAYIEGRTGEAALLLAALDEENDVLDEMRHERDTAQAEESRLTRENEDLQTALEAAEEKVLSLTSELENAQDEIKVLQLQIHEAGIDLA